MNSIEQEFSKMDQETFDSYLGDKPWVKKELQHKENKHQGGTISDWYLSRSYEYQVVHGQISNDDRFRDGPIHTSYVVDISYDEEAQEGWLETRNTVYKLGKRLNINFENEDLKND